MLYQILISEYTLVYEDIDTSLISSYLRLIPKTSYHDIIIIIFQYYNYHISILKSSYRDI